MSSTRCDSVPHKAYAFMGGHKDILDDRPVPHRTGSSRTNFECHPRGAHCAQCSLSNCEAYVVLEYLALQALKTGLSVRGAVGP